MVHKRGNTTGVNHRLRRRTLVVLKRRVEPRVELEVRLESGVRERARCQGQ